ncbi:hypothetical protein C7I36_01110 [Zobellella taiwanensis]|uniref:Uncharacterized protein n=1 Tax=Zobellella taiwanensis TaxID=347535 RepID=A0A2P7RE16_9GAMM|nr:hypothetical protein C7I36_01110 [Zobellella taiwanensis]
MPWMASAERYRDELEACREVGPLADPLRNGQRDQNHTQRAPRRPFCLRFPPTALKCPSLFTRSQPTRTKQGHNL